MEFLHRSSGVIPMGFRAGQCDLHRIPGLWSSAGDRAYRGGRSVAVANLGWAEATPMISQRLMWINHGYMMVYEIYGFV